jgi:hypothetical protein
LTLPQFSVSAARAQIITVILQLYGVLPRGPSPFYGPFQRDGGSFDCVHEIDLRILTYGQHRLRMYIQGQLSQYNFILLSLCSCFLTLPQFIVSSVCRQIVYHSYVAVLRGALHRGPAFSLLESLLAVYQNNLICNTNYHE